MQMNLQLHNAISDITGVTGMRILRDVVSGVTDPKHLAAHRDRRCKASEEEIAASLTGNYRSEHLFSLRQNLELYDTYQRQIEACDAEIETHLRKLAAQSDEPTTSLPASRTKRKPAGSEPRFEIRALLHLLTGGVDLTQIDAIGPYTALQVIAKIGTDMTR